MQRQTMMRFPGKNSTAILTVSEVSGYLRIHPTTLYRLLRRHELPAFKIGNDWRISAEAMNRWLDEIEARGTHTAVDTKPSERPIPEHGNGGKSHGPKSRI
jgi:excisionase family DNA binding protein